MYAAQANSPSTELTGDLDTGVTEIYVQDVSVLPAAPFLLTIGFDTSASETVLVTAVAGNMLTATRGVDGPAQPWVAGTKCARIFTAKDLNDLQANIRTLLSGLNAVGTDVEGLGEKVGTDSLDTEAQDLSGAVNELLAVAQSGVRSVNGKTGSVILGASDVGAMPDSYEAPVSSVNGQTGDVIINRVPLADNLYSPDNQEMYDAFIFRTSGGAASINSGEAELVHIDGNMIAVGRVNEELSISSSPGISATLDRAAWLASPLGSSTGDHVFSYANGEWTLSGSPVDLADYGISTSDIPIPVETLEINATGELEVSIDSEAWNDSALAEAAGTYVFSYDGEAWTYAAEPVDLADYGISIDGGEAQEFDAITVVYAPPVILSYTVTVHYVAMIRGTLVVAAPTAFRSIGLNQFDKAHNILDGYTINASGNVVASAGSYVCWVHAVGGLTDGYTVFSDSSNIVRVGFLATVPNAGTTGISLVAADAETTYITPQADGYICVATTDINSLCVHPRWSGYEDSTFEDYEESVIPIPTVDKDNNALPTATYGMPRLGGVFDTLNLDQGTYIQRIGRLAYSAAALETVEAMGVDYDYDATNIFYVLASPVTYALAVTVSDGYIVADFGTEEFIGSDVPVYAQNLYGQNLRDKLRTDVVTISKMDQTLSAAQLAQFIENLGLPSNTLAYLGYETIT